MPLANSDEKVSGRWSARQRDLEGQDGRQKSLICGLESRSQAEQHQARLEGLGGVSECVDRRSTDGKSMPPHLSAVHHKQGHLVPKGAPSILYDAQSFAH